MTDQELIAKLRECANLLGGNPLLLKAAARVEELTDDMYLPTPTAETGFAFKKIGAKMDGDHDV